MVAGEPQTLLARAPRRAIRSFERDPRRQRLRRQRDVDHRRVDHDHHLRDADHGEVQPATRIGSDQRRSSSAPRSVLPGAGDLRAASGRFGRARIWRSSSRSRPSASICSRTPNNADRSASKPVSTVSLPFSSDTIEGKADRAVAPSRPLIRIVYKPGSVATRASCTPT
jgi:hypothetical protein